MKGCHPTIFGGHCVRHVRCAACRQRARAYQTGNIYGKVQAKDGSVLPGVTVTLTGVGAPRRALLTVRVFSASLTFRLVRTL